jgi:hypothetical protein
MAGEKAKHQEDKAGAGTGGAAGAVGGAVVGGAIAGPPGAVVGGAVGAGAGAGAGEKTEKAAKGDASMNDDDRDWDEEERVRTGEVNAQR